MDLIIPINTAEDIQEYLKQKYKRTKKGKLKKMKS
jgi:hypothetical protein